MYVDNRGMLASSREYNVRRREPRYVSSIPIALQRFLRYGPFVTRGVSLDISMRGMSALVCGAPRVGETVVIALSLSGAPVDMLATVRHSSDARSGFEFYPLSPISQQGIEDWIQELKKHEESLFPYPYAYAARVGND
ncbi:MAG: PilZ domain-containing protein [Terriglobales bacterium]|jgi:PilZ domain-containing protein